jgi:trehalose 2-sulfotransferase
MTHYTAYMICTAPRSGSTMLCSLLAATGVAGNPASWFYETDVAAWRERLDLLGGEGDGANLAPVFQAAIKQGSGGTGVFGLRQQGESFRYLFDQLATLVADAITDVERFQKVFGPTLFIHLTRADKVEQAVSYLKAHQSGLWHVAPDGSELERVAAHRDPVYDGKEIKRLVQMLEGYDRQWAGWFAHEGISPLPILYEELNRDPEATLRDILDALGLDGRAAVGIVPGVRKLADGISEQWVARYRAESGGS